MEESNTETKTFWDFYNKCISDDGARRAQCTLCNNVYSYTSTVYNLKAHLFNVHSDVIGDLDVDFGSQRMKPRNSRKKSNIWEHFSIVEDEFRIANCNHCNKRMSFRSTTGNLKSHLSRVHPAVSVKPFSKDQDDETSEDDATVPYDDESEDESKLSEVRSFFERETGGRARCLICRESVPNHHADLRKHLDQHPKLLHEQQDSDTQVLNDDDDEQETYTEVVYLEDANPKETKKTEKKKWSNVPNDTPPKKWRLEESAPKSFKKRKTQHRRVSSSSDEPIIKRKKGDDEIRKFGEYIICLLQKLPRDVCMKMQMNIVNMIMNANLGSTSAETVPTVQPVPASVPIIQPVPASATVVQPVSGNVSILQSPTGTVPVTIQPVPPGYYLLAKNTSEKSLLPNTSTESVPVTSQVDGNQSYTASYITIAPSPAAITTVANNNSPKENEFEAENESLKNTS